MRALALALVALAGCTSTARCKASTVLLTLDLPAGSDSVNLAISIDGAVVAGPVQPLPPGTTHGTLELDFAAYPEGHTLEVTVVASGGGALLGSAMSQPHVLAKGCDAIAVVIAATSDAGNGLDGGSDGGAPADSSVLPGATCTQASDCPEGQACDTSTQLCTTSCSASQPCHGGCCDGTTCVAGNTADRCALGALCDSCAGNAAGQACLAVAGGSSCGCTSASDCPSYQACNPSTHTCGIACDASSPCNGGCCAPNAGGSGGSCQTGSIAAACGANGGLCADCGSNQNGHQCLADAKGGHCGCGQLSDCGAGASSCTSGLCVNSCSTSAACQSGCCSAATDGTCQAGTAPQACGPPGAICQSCAGNTDGSACLPSGACGCLKASDCPANRACDTASGKCTSACSATQPCNGGCCSGGACVAGNTTAACGSTGALCTVCPGATTCGSYGCDGSSCIVSYAPSTTQCAAADSLDCRKAAYCTGSSTSCPTGASSCTGNTRCCYPGCYGPTQQCP